MKIAKASESIVTITKHYTGLVYMLAYANGIFRIGRVDS